jgi:hypothetical protein
MTVDRSFFPSSPRHVCCMFLLPFTYADVAPVVDAEGRLDDGIFPHVAQQLFQYDHAVCSDGFEGRVGVVGELGVELVHQAPGFEADAGELGDEGVVAGGSWWVS